MNQSRVTISSARKLVAVMTGVVISFLLATLFAQFRASAIDQRVGDIVGNAMPSVQHLARARTALQRTLDDASRLEFASRAQVATLRDLVRGDRRGIEAAVAAERVFPLFPGEAALEQQIDREQGPFNAALEEVIAAAKTGVRARIREKLAALRGRALTLDDAIGRDIDFNAVQSQRLGLEISKIRRESLSLVVILDLISIGLALVAMVLSVRILRRSVRVLEERTEELEEKSKELEIFSTRLAHDLKGPLTAVLLAVEMAERPVSDEMRSELRRRVKRAAEMMSRIIDGLLDFARTGGHPLGKECDVATIAESVVSVVQEEARRSGVEIRLERTTCDTRVDCDPGAVGSVVSNLVRNAVKYVGGGQDPRHLVSVRVTRTESIVRFEVEDNGPGIAESDQKRIFNPYVRGNQEQPGIGMGLATVKRIIEANGGELGVKSVLGQGSCFWFELPFQLRDKMAQPSRGLSQTG